MDKITAKKESKTADPGMIEKISKPKNEIIERLLRQLNYVNEPNEVISGYSRMHNRHNRS